MTDPRVIDLAARIERLGKRIERLKTLEYGTAAFPSGGGLTAVCDTIVGAPVASVTCPTLIFPPPHPPHLLAIIAAGIPRLSPGLFVPKITVTVAGLVTGYEYATRQERIFVIGDTQATSLVPTVSWETIAPSTSSFFPSVPAQNSAMYIFPDPEGSLGNMANIAMWIGGGRFRSTGPFVLGLTEEGDQGGGFRTPKIPGGISSITWTAPPPRLFDTGSRFTVYHL